MTDWDMFESPAPLINMASRAYSRIAEKRLRQLGFGVGQIPVLFLLRGGNALSQKELAQFAKIEQPSMAQILSRMQRDGLIIRTPDPKDARSSLISLTPETLAKLPALRAALEDGREETLKGFSSDEITTLIDLLKRLNRNLDQFSAP